MSQIKVLFVCMGNICRSPTAEGVFRKVIEDRNTADRFLIDSAGTHAYHVGEPSDSRAQQTAKRRGVDLSKIRARKVSPSDFEYFDHVLAMDADNYHMLLAASPEEHQHKIALFLDYAPDHSEQDVPDPYYGGANGFEHVFDLVEDASQGFYQTVMKEK
jgi:protein-tyrosine phosphatase